MVLSRRSHHPNVFTKKGFLKFQTNSQGNIPGGVFIKACNFSKKLLKNKCFSVNGCKHMRTAASDLGKYLTTLTIIFNSVQNIWNLVHEAIWGPWLEHNVAWENCFFKIFQLMSRIFKVGLWSLGWQWGLLELSILMKKTKRRSVKNHLKGYIQLN